MTLDRSAGQLPVPIELGHRHPSSESDALSEEEHAAIDHGGLPGVGGAFLGARATVSGAQNAANDNDTVVEWHNETWDDGAIHAPGGTTFVVPAGEDGMWEYDVKVLLAPNASGTVRRLRMQKNGSDVSGYPLAAFPFNGTQSTDMRISDVIDLVAGDAIRFVVFQDRGGTLAIESGRAVFRRVG